MAKLGANVSDVTLDSRGDLILKLPLCIVLFAGLMGCAVPTNQSFDSTEVDWHSLMTHRPPQIDEVAAQRPRWPRPDDGVLLAVLGTRSTEVIRGSNRLVLIDMLVVSGSDIQNEACYRAIKRCVLKRGFEASLPIRNEDGKDVAALPPSWFDNSSRGGTPIPFYGMHEVTSPTGSAHVLVLPAWVSAAHPVGRLTATPSASLADCASSRRRLVVIHESSKAVSIN